MTITEFLKEKVALFQGISQEQAQALAQVTQQKPFAKGKTIILKGLSIDGLHIIASGKVSVHAKPNKFKPPVVVAEIGPGEVFGETSIFEGSMASATVKSEADDTLIFILPQDAFRGLLDSVPAIKQRTEALIAQRKAAAQPEKKEAG